MSPEKWQNIIGMVKDKFPVEEHDNYHDDEAGSRDVEYIIFAGPLGRMKLEYVSRPIVLGKKTTYSRRIGSDTKVDYVYSDTDKSHKMTAYKWDEAQDDWVEMEAGVFEK